MAKYNLTDRYDFKTTMEMINHVMEKNSNVDVEERKKICSLITDNLGFLKTALEAEEQNKANRQIKFGLYRETLDVHKLFQKDMALHRGFILDTSINYADLKDETKMIDSDSIFSYKFGIRSNDSRAVQAKRYRCKCGALEEPMSGIKCSKCGTETQNLYDIRGWFVIDKFKVFEPDWLSLFLANINKNVCNKKQLLENLLQFSSIKNKKGPNLLDLQDKDNLIDFINKYAAEDKKQYFLSTVKTAMISEIPVISKDYRYYSVVNKIGNESSVNSHPLNKMYISISDSVRILNNMRGKESPAQKLACLSRITQRLLDIYEETKKTLGGSKESYIRGRIGGRRNGYSGRLVVEALMHVRNDVCILPYSVFGEFTIDYHRELYIKHGMSPEAENRMRNNYPSKNDKIIMVKVFKELKKRNLNTIFMYRPPCLYIGSLICVEIIGLTNHNVVFIENTTLDAALHGDKDGDILGLFMLPPEVRATTYFAFNPKRIILDPIKGCINDSFELVEAIQYISCKVLDDTEQDSGEILTEEDMKSIKE